jgi:hypothetical protein
VGWKNKKRGKVRFHHIITINMDHTLITMNLDTIVAMTLDTTVTFVI